jgi:multidrug efflux pump
LLFALALTLFLTPVLYDLLARFTRPRGAIERQLALELEPGLNTRTQSSE